MTMRRLAFAAFGVLAVSACSTTPPDEMLDPSIVRVEERIADAVEVSAAANRSISEVEVATSAPVRMGPAQTLPDDVVLPPSAVQPISVDWNGPVESFLMAIASRADYELSVIGRAPTNQVMISLMAEDEPLFGVVRRAGNLVNGYADIGFNPDAGIIELRYGG